MKRITKCLALLLALVMFLQLAELPAAQAAEQVKTALDPASRIELRTPDSLRDGGNYFFIREDHTVSEKSGENLYIPIQRTGDLSQEADITLKLVDMTAHFGVNYDAEIYHQKIEPTVDYDGVSMVDAFLNADSIEEVDLDEMADEAAQEVYAAGGADFVGADGEVLGTLTAYPTDEEGNPIQDEPAADKAATDSSMSLQAARDAYTGTVSDRQQLDGGGLDALTAGEEAAAGAIGDQAQENYPGREYALHFGAGEEALFLVITPKYSEAADGDSTIMLLLKNQPEGATVPEDFNMRSVLILDEDEPEEVVISFAEPELRAADGVASVKVTRQGRVNAMVGVYLASNDGTAKAGDDYSGVGAKLYFPMGILERTVELPVGHGAEEKDFYLYLTPLSESCGVTVDVSSAHVVIPAAEGGVALLADEDDDRYGDAWNLKDRKWYWTAKEKEFRSNNMSIFLRSKNDDDDKDNWVQLHPQEGYAYDGFHVDYDIYTNWCKGRAFLWDNKGGEWRETYRKNHGDCGNEKGLTMEALYESAKAPNEIAIGMRNYDNKWADFRDCHVKFWINQVRPIKRKFTVQLQNPEPLRFKGMTDAQVLKNYQNTILDDALETKATYQTGDHFSVSRLGAQEWARLTGLVAVASDGRTMSIGTTDGKTSTVDVQLSEAVINALAEGGFITWKENKGSYSGTINVRPVYDYVQDVTVKVRDTGYGGVALKDESVLAPGTYTFHYGDKLTFKANATAKSIGDDLRPVGIGHQRRETGAAGQLIGQQDCDYFVVRNDPAKDDSPTFILTEDYYEFWQVFSAEDNKVRLRVKEDDLQYFNTDVGVFEDLKLETADGGYRYYTVKPSAVTNEFINMTAVVKDSKNVPVWTLPNSNTVYSGDMFWFFAGVKASDNVITLGVDRDEQNHAYYSFSGVTYTSTLNLSSEHEAFDVIPVKDAMIIAPLGGGVSMAEGDFDLSANYLVAGTTMRYLVSYNGVTDIREVRLAPADAAKMPASYEGRDGSVETVQAIPVSLGNIEVNTWTPGGARFSGLTVSLGGFNTSAISAVELNGKKLEVSLTVDPGSGYLTTDSSGNAVTVEEHIVDVRLYFQNSLTGEIHGDYSVKAENEKFRLAWDAATNTAKLSIREFKPDAPELYTYGDVLMAELITDRSTGVNQFMDWDMVYQPVSTGFMVIADQDYVPTTFNYDVNIPEMLSSDIEGTQEEGERRANFGQFPWLGAVSAAIKVFAKYSSVTKYNDAAKIIEDLEDMGDDGELESDDGELMESAFSKRRWAMSALVVMKDTYYGGCRIMVGVAMTTGSGQYQKRANPYQTARSTYEYLLGGDKLKSDTGLIFNTHNRNTRKQNESFYDSEFGGGYLTFSVYVGFYIDFGYIEITDDQGGDDYDMSHDLVFMGAGGFIGAQLTAGYTAYIYPAGMPIYANLEAYLNVTLFLGASADPNKTLEEAYYNNDQQTGNDWGFQLEVDGQVGAKATLGFGIAKVASVRGGFGLGVRAGYSPSIKKWYPDLTGADTLSFSTDVQFSCGVDTPFGSYDLWSASFPLPWGYGWLQYFQQVTRANKLIHFIKQNIDEGYCPDSKIDEARRRVDVLADYVDQYSGDGPTLRKKVDGLKNWARSNHALGPNEEVMVETIRMGGIVGNIMGCVMLTGDEEPSDQNFHVNDHVDSTWVAGDDASLMAAFGPVESRKLVDNALSQPCSQIIALGGNRFLVAFLDDDTSRERQQAYTLKYTVYDANAGTWTKPVTIQDDGTGDSQANLVDAKDKIIISWTSIAPAKLQALKDAVAAEYRQKNGYTPGAEQIALELEADPARVLKQTDVFTVQLDKQTCTLGPIEQLTDDDFYDAGPQAVYDNETGDYIILFSKTAQDSEEYDSAGERFENMISGNPDDNTYSVLAYMLYNNQTAAKDTRGNTHEPGWARDYYFPNETDMDLATQELILELYGGQRFLSSALRAEDGGQTDMPISDLTVARGYNGLAAYAFTVDKDFDLDTNDDRDLFVQFYRFSDHSTYVPVKVAGEEENYVLDRGTGELTGTAMKEVGVNQPRLIRNDGSTMLFWRQADEGLYYLNVSEMLNAVVAAEDSEDADGSNTVYAVRPDGSFAVDAHTGQPYQPEVQKVDFGSALTDEKLTATDYQVVTDKDDNLYVVWTDTGLYQNQIDDDTIVTQPTLGIYATALIKEELKAGPEDGEGVTAAWSKPYLLTRDQTSNDGLAIALDESDGSLIVVHNQYEMLYADTEEKQLRMVEKGQAGIKTVEEDGEEKAYFVGYPYYPSEISLMVTRFAPIGSVEATQFEFSDATPVAGQSIAVAAAIENTGLTTAEGCDIKVYEYKDGVQGRQIYSVASGERLPVNKAKKITFPWTVPADGPEGYCLQTVIREKKTGGGYYDAIENYSEPFELKPEYEPELEQCVQNGDSFDVRFRVTNTGNAPAPEGTSVNLFLQALHGDLKERYGMDDDTLVNVDISGLAPGETTAVVRSVTLPVSVFRFCGYDAVAVSVLDKDEQMLATTDQELISLISPINLKLNGGKSVNVDAGKTAQAVLTYDSTVFMDTGVLYSVADPSIASVDAEGNVTGLADGVTTLTATILPGGRSKRVQVKVGEGCKRDQRCPISRFTDASPTAWYHDGVHWALDEGVMNGVGNGKFAPESPTSRAMIVTMLYRMEGEPEVSGNAPFQDVAAGQWYSKAVDWAFANEIVNGYSAEKFGPDDRLTREQLATILERYAKFKGMDVSKGEEAYLTGYEDGGNISDWAVKAFRWAVDAGIIRGVSDTRLSPKTDATRAQVATMLVRYNDLK